MTSLYPVKFQTRKERDRIRDAVADICRSAGFFSRHQTTVPSPPALLRFIVKNADSFKGWVQETQDDEPQK